MCHLKIFGEDLEGRYLLSHICGHNLCLDVFGAHTEKESAHAGRAMSFHGEAGQSTSINYYLPVIISIWLLVAVYVYSFANGYVLLVFTTDVHVQVES